MLLSSGSVVVAQPKKAMSVLNRRKRAVVRHLFQEIGRRQKEKLTTQDIYGNVSEIKPETATVFEKTNAPFSPAIVREPPHILRWKDGVNRSTEGRLTTSMRREKLLQFGSEIDKEADTAIRRLQRTNDFRIASHIMGDVKKQNILETALNKQKNDVLRRFFQKGEDPTIEVMDALREAMEACFKTYCERLAQEEQNSTNQEKREFLKDEEKAKQVMLDVLMRCSEYLPTVWGGTQSGDAVVEVLPSESEMTTSRRTGETDVDALIRNMDNDEELKKIESDSDFDVEIKKALAMLGLDKTCKTVMTRLSSKKHSKIKTKESNLTTKRSKEQVNNKRVKVNEPRKSSGEKQEKSCIKRLGSKIMNQGQRITNKAASTGAYLGKISAKRSREIVKAPKPAK